LCKYLIFIYPTEDNKKEVLHMDEATIKSRAAELAKGLKTPEDLNQMTAIFKC
jgi:hypothetical protein